MKIFFLVSIKDFSWVIKSILSIRCKYFFRWGFIWLRDPGQSIIHYWFCLLTTTDNCLIHPWKLWPSSHSLINFHMNPLEKYWNVEILQKQSKILGSFYGWIQVIYLSDLVRVCRSCNQLKSERKNALGKKQRALRKPS